MKVSIVMANYNRRKLLINTLKSIEYHNKNRDIEVIVVDDNSSKAESVLDVPDLFSIPVIIIPIAKQDKNWMCCCMPFNIGFSYVTGDIVIIQNPENLHVGDIAGYALKNIRKNVFFSFALYSMNQKDTDNLYENAISKNILSGEGIRKVIGPLVGKKETWTDGDTCWYNHSLYQPAGHHLISAIMRKDLEELGGFDERYGKGFAYDDFEFRTRLKRKGMLTKIVDNPFAIHQRHELAAYVKNKVEFERNAHFYSNVTLRERGYKSPENTFYCPVTKPRFSKKANITPITACPITGSSSSMEFLNLGNVPLVNNLCNTQEESLSCQKFPLAVQLFTDSKLTCLTETVNKDSLFLNYVYQSGVNKPFLTHCSQMYGFLSKYIGLNPRDIVVDIGGNDGSLLLEFKKINPKLEYINIDASKSFIEINEKAGLKYINKYFDEKYQLPEKAKLLISTNVFQHTLPIRSFVKGIHNNLSDDGVWCLEFPYLLTTLMYDNYDQVYHEHVYYYLLSNIIELLKQEGMKAYHVSFHNIHSGTLRVLSVKDTNTHTAIDHSIDTFLSLEATLTEEYYTQWGKRTLDKVEAFKSYINALTDKGASVACFGAAAKGCVFLNSCGLDYTTIKFIVDDTPLKQWKFVPGTGIQIVPREELKNTKVDYLIILAHNFKDYIIRSLANQYKGKYIIMFPDIKVI